MLVASFIVVVVKIVKPKFSAILKSMVALEGSRLELVGLFGV
jgi:hypothetical protein